MGFRLNCIYAKCGVGTPFRHCRKNGRRENRMWHRRFPARHFTIVATIDSIEDFSLHSVLFSPSHPPFFWCHAIDFHLWHRIFARSKNNKRTGCDSWQPTAPGTFGVNTSFGFQWLNWLLRGHKLASTWPLTSAPFDSLK